MPIIFALLTTYYSPRSFTEWIHPSLNQPSVQVALLDSVDHRMYFVHQETHKLQYPERYSFLGFPVHFMSFKEDSYNGLKTSIVIYLKDSGSLMTKLEETFGPSTSSFSLSGEGMHAGSASLSHESIAWKTDTETMLVATARREEKETLVRIWIRKSKY